MSTSEPSAASTPWFVVGPPWNEGAPWINAGSEDAHGGEFVCDLTWPYEEIKPENVARTEANAELIVQAVNEREGLHEKIEGLEQILAALIEGDLSADEAREAWSHV